MSNHALITLSDALRGHRAKIGTRWRRLSVGEQAMLVLAHLRKGDTYVELAAGYGIGTTTVFRYITEETLTGTGRPEANQDEVANAEADLIRWRHGVLSSARLMLPAWRISRARSPFGLAR